MKQKVSAVKQKPIAYRQARLIFFMLEEDRDMVVQGKHHEITQFRDSIYKLSKRYKAYGKMYKTKLISPTKLQIWRIK